MTTKSEAIHIVDDDAAIRDSLVWLLSTLGRPVTAYPSAEAFLVASPETLRGCAVVDMRMAGASGLDVLDELSLRHSVLPVIILTGHGDVPMAVEALKKGAVDFLEKPFDPSQLTAKVEAALVEGRRRADAAVMQLETSEKLRSLSPREREVMDLMLAGQLNKQIADTLGIAMRTVEVHRARILEKFAVRTAVELAQVVARMP